MSIPAGPSLLLLGLISHWNAPRLKVTESSLFISSTKKVLVCVKGKDQQRCVCDRYVVFFLRADTETDLIINFELYLSNTDTSNRKNDQIQLIITFII